MNTPVLTNAHMPANVPKESEAVVTDTPKYPKRDRKGITRWPIEIEDEIAEDFEETRTRVYPLAKRNGVIRELIVKFIAENKGKK
jgi:hypothetical protein